MKFKAKAPVEEGIIQSKTTLWKKGSYHQRQHWSILWISMNLAIPNKQQWKHAASATINNIATNATKQHNCRMKQWAM